MKTEIKNIDNPEWDLHQKPKSHCLTLGIKTTYKKNKDSGIHLLNEHAHLKVI